MSICFYVMSLDGVFSLLLWVFSTSGEWWMPRIFSPPAAKLIIRGWNSIWGSSRSRVHGTLHKSGTYSKFWQNWRILLVLKKVARTPSFDKVAFWISQFCIDPLHLLYWNKDGPQILTELLSKELCQISNQLLNCLKSCLQWTQFALLVCGPV